MYENITAFEAIDTIELQIFINQLDSMINIYSEIANILKDTIPNIHLAWQGISATTWTAYMSHNQQMYETISQALENIHISAIRYIQEIEKIYSKFRELRDNHFIALQICDFTDIKQILTPLIEYKNNNDQIFIKILTDNIAILYKIIQNENKSIGNILIPLFKHGIKTSLLDVNLLNELSKKDYSETTVAKLTQLINQPIDTTEKSIQQINTFFSQISQQEALELTFLYPKLIGNLAGVPYKYRIIANKKNILQEKDKREKRLLETEQKIEKINKKIAKNNNNISLIKKYEQLISEQKSHIKILANYQNAIERQAKIIQIEDQDDGRYIEMFGNLDKNTKNIYTIIPGTGASLENISRYSEYAANIKNNTPNNETTGFYWMGTDFPNKVFPNAISKTYAENGGKELQKFAQTLKSEIDSIKNISKQKINNTSISYSYGAAIVGVAETKHNYLTDQAIYIAPAGIAIKQSNKISRFWIQSYNDPIVLAQKSGMHGQTPESIKNINKIDSGLLEQNNPSKGKIKGHSQYFSKNSETINNIIKIVTQRKTNL